MVCNVPIPEKYSYSYKHNTGFTVVIIPRRRCHDCNTVQYLWLIRRVIFNIVFLLAVTL